VKEQLVVDIQKNGGSFTILQLQSKLNIADSDLGEEIAGAMTEENCSVITAFLKGRAERQLGTQANEIKCFDLTEWSLKGIARYFFAWKLYRYCRLKKVDLIIAHRFKQIHLVHLISRWLKVPVIGVVHGVGDYDRLQRRLALRSFLSRGSKFVAVSESVKRYLQDLNLGADDTNLQVINNAIDIDAATATLLSRVRARQELGISSEALVVGTVGRMVPVKGHMSLLKAVPKLRKLYPNFQLVIIGDGRERKALQSFVDECGLQAAVVFAGWKDNASRFMSAFDVFILPSRSEGLPLALLEAMSASLPVVGSDIDAIKSVLPSYSESFSVDDSQAIVQSLEKLLSLTKEQRKSSGALSYAHVCRNHGLEDFHNSYRALMSSQLEIHDSHGA